MSEPLEPKARANRAVSIIVVTWNGLDFTRACLESIRRVTRFESYDIVVVDNGSTDGTIEYLAELEGVGVIANSENMGFAKANNIGIESIPGGNDAILLNNDTVIVDPAWISKLQECAYSSPEVGPVGCRLVRPHGGLQHLGAYMPLETLWGQQIAGGEKDINQLSDNRFVESVVFACAYLRREVLDRVGLLEEEYVSYFEDSDYCARAKKVGYRSVCCGDAKVLHYENISTKVNGVSHSTVFRRAQEVFRRRWGEELEDGRYNDSIAMAFAVQFHVGLRDQFTTDRGRT